MHGTDDHEVPIEMSRSLAEALTREGIEHVYAELPADHMQIMRRDATNALVEAFLGYQLRPDD